MFYFYVYTLRHLSCVQGGFITANAVVVTLRKAQLPEHVLKGIWSAAKSATTPVSDM